MAQGAPTGSGRPAGTGWRTIARRGLLVVFLGAVAAGLAMALRNQDWSVLARATTGRRHGFFAFIVAAAIVANAASLLLVMFAWRATLTGLGERVGAAAAARIFFVGQFAKFVPGKVVGLLVTIQMGRSIGVTARRMASAYLLMVVMLLLTGLAVGLAAGPSTIGTATGWLALAAVPVAGVLVRPQLADRAAALTARVLRRPAPVNRASGRGIRQAVVALLFAWVLGGIQLWLLAVAMGASPAGSILLCVGAFSFATVAGMLAVFAPEGIGVRELVLLAALGLALPLPVATVVVLVSRLVTIVSELATAAVGLLVTEVGRARRRALPAGEPEAAQGH